MAVRYRYTSHESFSHDSIDSLGYDWERVANPAIAPRFPFKVYLPRSTADVVRAVREARTLGQRLRVRSKGHSSNDLVLEEGGAVLCTEKLDRILALDEDARTVTVQSGAVLADVDLALARHDLGLPVIGDHNHITAGGFAAVGGISPASHRYGMFVDTVRALEYVTWDGEVVACSRTERPADFHRLLAGLGRHGVVTTLTLDLVPVAKLRTIVRNDMRLFRDVDAFVRESHRAIEDPGDALYERGLWADLRGFHIGQFSRYHAIRQGAYPSLRNRLAYGYLHGLGYWAGRLPHAIDMLVKYLGIAGVVFSPRYASMKNVEFFTDKILDSSVGDPTRMLIALAPRDRYPELFHEMYEMCREARRRTGCFTMITLYVKAVCSPYLARAAGRDDPGFCELMLYLGIDPARMTDAILGDLVARLDALCIRTGAFRYMHTKTGTDPAVLAHVDPNAFYAGEVSGPAVPAAAALSSASPASRDIAPV